MSVCPAVARRNRILMLAIILLMGAFAFLGSSCGQTGNATEVQKAQLLQAVRSYWENERDYNLGFTSGVGDLNHADVQGDEAEVEVDIVVGYSQPTDGAGYKPTTFHLRKENGSWEVTYDGWASKDV
jgi:hypothetical protein